MVKTTAQFWAIQKFQHVTRMKNCVIRKFRIVKKKSPFNEMCSMAGRAGRNLPVFLRRLKTENHSRSERTSALTPGNWRGRMPSSCSSSPVLCRYSPNTVESRDYAQSPWGYRHLMDFLFWRLDFRGWNCRFLSSSYSCDRGSAWQDGSCATQLHPARFGASLLSGKNVDEGGRKGGGRKNPEVAL